MLERFNVINENKKFIMMKMLKNNIIIMSTVININDLSINCFIVLL